MNNELKCPICGEITNRWYANGRKDGLCRKHAKMKEKGLIYQCPDCGKWHKKFEFCDCKNKKEEEKNVIAKTESPTIKQNENIENNKTSNESTCIICGEPSNGNQFCNSCYLKIQEHIKNINKNEDYFSLKDHYYNLKSSIFRIINKKYVITNIYRLTALAWAMKIYHRNDDLNDRLADDIKYILEIKKIKYKKTEEINLKDNSIDEIIEDKINIATANIKENRAIDGHLCLSPQEVFIDDYLYQNDITHAYNKPVKEIPETERAVIADWFIPIPTKGKGKGVYIEYWGIEDEENYEENKKEKLPLYEKYEVSLIQINKNDIKDTQTLETFLFRKLKENGYPI